VTQLRDQRVAARWKGVDQEDPGGEIGYTEDRIAPTYPVDDKGDCRTTQRDVRIVRAIENGHTGPGLEAYEDGLPCHGRLRVDRRRADVDGGGIVCRGLAACCFSPAPALALPPSTC